MSLKMGLKKERIDEIQYLRGIAFLAVVFQHTIGMFSRTPGFTLSDLVLFSFLFNLAKFAVPLFVFITGVVTFYNYYEQLNYITYLRKRIKEILIPYLLFTLFYYYYWDWQASQHHLSEFWSVFLTGSGYYHLWFIVLIFQFYLCFPVFRFLIQRVAPFVKSERSAFFILLCFLCLFIFTTWAIFAYHNNLHTNVFGLRGMLAHVDRTLFTWYFYFILGACVGLSIHRWRAWVSKIQFWNIPLFVIGLLWVTYELGKGMFPQAKIPAQFPLDLGASHSFKASMILFSISSIVIFYSIAISMSKRSDMVSKSFYLLGKYSFGTYLIHAYMLDKFYKIVLHHAHGINSSLMMLCTVLLCTAGSLILTVVISYIPFGSWLVGSSGRKKTLWVSIQQFSQKFTA